MSRFDYCLRVILGHEGGVSNHKADRGGLTAYGVTQKTYDDFCRLTGREKKPVSEISMSEVEAIYGGYWKDAQCSYMPEPLDLIMFDVAVNSGAGRAIKTLQQALGVDADGVCGKQTVSALHEEVAVGGIQQLCSEYLDIREDFYNRLVERDESQAVFLKGWLNRVDHLRDMTCG